MRTTLTFFNFDIHFINTHGNSDLSEIKFHYLPGQLLKSMNAVILVTKS